MNPIFGVRFSFYGGSKCQSEPVHKNSNPSRFLQPSHQDGSKCKVELGSKRIRTSKMRPKRIVISISP